MIKSKTKSKNDKPIALSKYSVKHDSRGRRLMVCENSEVGGKYWKGHLCNEWTVVGNDATSVICWKCTSAICDAPVTRSAAVKSDKPKGWKFMKEFVAADGTVYHKGEEQVSLKGTLPVTVIEPKAEKKKLTKQEKEDAILQLGKEIESLKVKIFHETLKGKKALYIKELSKANKLLKKLI